MPSRAQKPHRSILNCTRAPKAAPSRNPSPLYRPCLQLVPSAPLSGLVRPAPQWPPATPQPEATLPPLPQLALPTSPRLPSSALTEPTRVLWYAFHDFNWHIGDDTRMECGPMARQELWLTIVVVHRGREDQRPRPHREVAPGSPGCFPKGRQAQPDPPRSLALRLRQAADCPGAPEAHWRRRQGRHRQELPQHTGREQPIGRTTGCRREVRCAHGCTPRRG